MGYRYLDDAITTRLHEFISMLNEESENGSIIVVEGKRDVEDSCARGIQGKFNCLQSFQRHHRFC